MTWPVSRLCRYPVKGLSAEFLETVSLIQDRELPEDRRFAIALPTAPFDESAPEWLAKTHFLMLARNEKLAALDVRFDAETGVLEIAEADRVRVSTDITQPSGRTEIEDFFAEFCAEALKGRPKFTEAAGHSFSDHRHKVLSFINLKSVRELGEEMGVDLDPIRFRGNVYFEGDAAWQEFDWTGRRISLGRAELKVTQRIDRCAATNVNPTSAVRDLNIPKALQRAYGHIDMGVYARVVSGGAVGLGDEISLK